MNAKDAYDSVWEGVSDESKKFDISIQEYTYNILVRGGTKNYDKIDTNEFQKSYNIVIDRETLIFHVVNFGKNLYYSIIDQQCYFKSLEYKKELLSQIDDYITNNFIYSKYEVLTEEELYTRLLNYSGDDIYDPDINKGHNYIEDDLERVSVAIFIRSKYFFK